MEKVKKTPRRLRQKHAKAEKGHVSWAKVGMVVKTPRTDHDDHGLNMFKYPSPNSRLGESCQDQMQKYMDPFKLPITSNHLSKIKKSNHSTSACNASKTKLLEWKGGKNLWALWPPSISWRLAQNRPQLSYPKKVGWLSVIGIETDLCGLALRMKLKKGDQQFWAPFLVVSCCIKMWKEIAIIFRITMAHVLGYISCILRHTHTSKCATSPGFFFPVWRILQRFLSQMFSQPHAANFLHQTCGEYLACLADKIGSAVEPAEVWQDLARCTCCHVGTSRPPETEALHQICKPPEQHKVPFIHISQHGITWLRPFRSWERYAPTISSIPQALWEIDWPQAT